MDWFLVALINPVAHAIANHFDKYLISRWMQEVNSGVLLLFSCLFAVVVLPVLLFLDPGLMSAISVGESVALVINGSFLACAIMLYLKALEQDEASYVVPFFELIPVFGLGLGYFVLGEVLTVKQFWAAILIVFGSTILSLEFIGGKARIKFSVVILMLGSSLFYAINGIVFKLLTPNQGFIPGLFWNTLGMVLFGIIMLIFKPEYRRQFLHLLKSHRYKLVGLNALNEVVVLIGEISLMFALLVAPVAIVFSIGALQPLFVLLFGVILTLFLPKFGRESLFLHHIMQKILAVSVITVGVILLDVNGA